MDYVFSLIGGPKDGAEYDTRSHDIEAAYLAGVFNAMELGGGQEATIAGDRAIYEVTAWRIEEGIMRVELRHVR